MIINNPLSNQKGTMLAEFALIIPLFVIAVLFMIFVDDLYGHTNVHQSH